MYLDKLTPFLYHHAYVHILTLPAQSAKMSCDTECVRAQQVTKVC